MIITCPCGEKKFEVNQELIPDKGRLLKLIDQSKKKKKRNMFQMKIFQLFIRKNLIQVILYSKYLVI